MDRGAWRAIVHGGHKRVGQDLATKQQQQQLIIQALLNWLSWKIL